MTTDLTNIAIGGTLALLILREVFNFIMRARAGKDSIVANNAASGRHAMQAEAAESIQKSLDAIVIRLDRIVERLDDLNESTKASKKQSEITSEQTERVCRAVSQLEETMAELVTRPWPKGKILTT